MSPHEMRPDTLLKLHRYPEIYIRRERNPEVLASAPDEDLGPSTDCRGIPRDPRYSHGDWTILRLNKWVHKVPVLTQGEPQVSCHSSRETRRFSPQRKMRPFFCFGSSREIPTSFLSLKRVLDTLDATQEVPQHICLHSRGTPSVPPQLKSAPFFPPHLEMRVHFPASLG